MQYRYIAIEGNIGSGKTTLAQQLADHYNATLILEAFGDNPFLEKFYHDRARFAFPLELAFLADRYKQLKDLLPTQELFQSHIISDYIFPKTKLFAKVNLDETEYELFARIAEFLKVDLSIPDLLIYLYAKVPTLQANIHKRARSYEQQIPDDYLAAVEAGYQQYLPQHPGPMLLIDVTVVDIRDPFYFQQIIDFLESGTSFHRHTLAFVHK